MLLVGSDLDIVRADSGLVLIRVIKTLDIVQITDVQSSDVIGSGQSEIDEAAVLGDIGAVGSIVSVCDYFQGERFCELTKWQ